MSKKAVALDLDPSNLEWLQAQTAATGKPTLSEIVNDMISRVRNAGEPRKVQSVVGMAHISEDGPDLAGADAAVRKLFEASHGRFSIR
jgi:hypothetical protein